MIQVRDMVSIGLLGLLIARCKRIPFVYWVSFLMCEARVARARTQLAAQDSQASARASLAANHVRLYKALGGGWAAGSADPK